MALDYRNLEITEISSTADNAVCVSFQIPPAMRDEFKFVPGQHLTFRRSIDGKEQRRFYSICSPDDDNELRIGVRQIDEGQFSGFFNQQAKSGDTLEVLAPRGRFCLDSDASSKHILAFASGSGITPIYAMIQHHLASDERSTATLVYGNRQTSSIMLRQDLNDLKDEYLDRFQIIHLLSREQQDIGQFNGRVDRDNILGLAKSGLIEPVSAAQILVCGPGAMIDAVSKTLNELGADDAKIAAERFTAVDQKPVVISKDVQETIDKGVQVKFVLDGMEKSFSISDANDTVLTAAVKSGFELPFSCAGGMCATCRCKLVEGDVEMDANYSLEKWELEAGFVLACQSRPKTDKLVLDFDAI